MSVDTQNIRIKTPTHRRLKYLAGLLGLNASDTPTIDDVLNESFDLLEVKLSPLASAPPKAETNNVR